MSGHEIHHLVHQYGYALVFVVVALQALCLPLPGTTALVVAAGYAAATHGLSIVGVIAVGALGALIGTTAGYVVGRWGGEKLLARIAGRLRQSPERLERFKAEIALHGGPWIFIARFITGLRNIAGLLAGSSGMPLARFLRFSALAALVWALTNGLEYYWFGRALLSADTWLQVLLVVLGLAWTIGSFVLLRRRAVRRLRRRVGRRVIKSARPRA